MNKHQERKGTPVYSGFLMYFPDAVKAMAKCSQVGNDQHNKNQPLHWARSKSGDEQDCMIRHAMDAGCVEPMDDDEVLHATKEGWRACANLQKTLELLGLAPMSPYNGMTNEEAIAHFLKNHEPDEPTLLEDSDYAEGFDEAIFEKTEGMINNGIIDGTPIAEITSKESSS